MEKNEKYLPFAPCPEGHYAQHGESYLFEKWLSSFSNILCVHRGLIQKEFRLALRDVLRGKNIIRSTFSDMMNGRIPGITPPLHSIPPGAVKRVDQMLLLMDVIETFAHRYLEGLIKEQSTGVKAEVEEMVGALGTVKLPRLTEAVYGLEESKVKGHKRKGSLQTADSKRKG